MLELTVSQIKGTSGIRTRKLPKEGTKIREVYDAFQDNKGKIIDFSMSYHNTQILRVLTDRHGMDIRNFGKSKWCLVGEWFGKVYIDYLTE